MNQVGSLLSKHTEGECEQRFAISPSFQQFGWVLRRLQPQLFYLISLGFFTERRRRKDRNGPRSGFVRERSGLTSVSYITLRRTLRKIRPRFKNHWNRIQLFIGTCDTLYISKQDNHMRKLISTERRLVAILRYLATERNLEYLKFSCGISPQALGKIIQDPA